MAEKVDVRIFAQTGENPDISWVGTIEITREDDASHAGQLAYGLRDMADAIEEQFG